MSTHTDRLLGQRFGASIVLSMVFAVLSGCGSDNDGEQQRGGSASGSGNAGGSPSGSGDAASSSSTGGSGGGDSAGSPASTATRPQLTSVQAADYTILKYLEKAGPLSALVIDNWDPTAGLGDVTGFIPTYTVAASGGTHTTVQSAIDAATATGGANRLYIMVLPGTYREVVCIPPTAPPITLYSPSSDASQTVIVYNNYSGKTKLVGESANPCNPNANATTYGTSGSATFAAYAQDFQAKNITFSNDTDESGVGESTQAVALMTRADKMVFENVRMLSNHDTFYTKTLDVDTVARSYVKGSYIEGDVDFIMGRGTVVLDDCTIQYLTARRGSEGGYIFAPSTDVRNPFGMLLINSNLTAEAGTPDGLIHLGRAWDESQVDLTKYAMSVATGVYPNGLAVIRESTLDAHIRSADPWSASAITGRPFSSTQWDFPANRLYEYGNTGPGNGH